MNRQSKYSKFDSKSKNKSFRHSQFDEENVSFRELKKEKEHKHYRNFENALRSKNISALLEYEDD